MKLDAAPTATPTAREALYPLTAERFAIDFFADDDRVKATLKIHAIGDPERLPANVAIELASALRALLPSLPPSARYAVERRLAT